MCVYVRGYKVQCPSSWCGFVAVGAIIPEAAKLCIYKDCVPFWICQYNMGLLDSLPHRLLYLAYGDGHFGNRACSKIARWNPPAITDDLRWLQRSCQESVKFRPWKSAFCVGALALQVVGGTVA